MLYSKNDSAFYIQQFKKKMTNFCEKAPILLSFTTTPQGVQVVNEYTDDIFDFEWDFSVPLKLFIYGIKQILRENNQYPTLITVQGTIEDISEKEQVEMAAQGIPLDNIPIKKVIKKESTYIIDKVIIYKDIFILEDMNTGKKYRYRLKKSSAFFLRKLRSGKLTPQQAATYFMNNSELLNEIIPNQESNTENPENFNDRENE